MSRKKQYVKLLHGAYRNASGIKKRPKIKSGKGGAVITTKECKCGGELIYDRNRAEIYCNECGHLWGLWSVKGIGVTLIPTKVLENGYFMMRENWWGEKL